MWGHLRFLKIILGFENFNFLIAKFFKKNSTIISNDPTLKMHIAREPFNLEIYDLYPFLHAKPEITGISRLGHT
jgi:hypothetical protein